MTDVTDAKLIAAAREQAEHADQWHRYELRGPIPAPLLFKDQRDMLQVLADRLEARSPPHGDGDGDVVAWCEKDGDEWVCYDADSDTGQHVRDYQKDRHGISIFPLRSAAPAAPVGEGLREVVAFLLGEGPLDGQWFGDSPPDGQKGAFWWRHRLRQALVAAALSSPAPEPGAQPDTRSMSELEAWTGTDDFDTAPQTSPEKD